MNLPTAIIGLGVLTVFLAIVARGIYNHRQGKHSCSCGDCAHCGGCRKE